MSSKHLFFTVSLLVSAVSFWDADQVRAVGVLYSDPGWFYAYDGDEAFYNDPDGPNPDYLCTSGCVANSPGGQGNFAALVDPGLNGTGQVDNDNAKWIGGNQWDGSAPGDPFGGTPGDPPPIPPAAPGGVETYTEGATDFLRIQDPGHPTSWGFADKGQSAGPGAAQQEGSNRKIQFAHPIDRDASFSGNPNIIDRGMTVSFRARLSVAGPGLPLDDIYVEGGPGASAPLAWPSDGKGYTVANDGRGMFHITQTSAAGVGQQMAFSLLDNDTITSNGLTSITTTGLVMNNRANPAAANDVDTNAATVDTLNIVEIDDGTDGDSNNDLDDWHEFWITIGAIQLNGSNVPVPDANGNTHEVNVYLDGSLVPETFELVLAAENEFGAGAHLGLGLSSGSRLGAYDIDFYAYSEGTVAPSLAGNAGDYNSDGVVNAADYTVWLDNLGAAAGTLPNDTDGGVIGQAQFDTWKANFGIGAAVGAIASIPEPASAMLLALGFIGLCRARSRRLTI